MPTHLEVAVKACSKALSEAKKLEKEWRAAKSPQDKEKLKKMAAAARKMGELYFDSIDAAKLKDKADMLNTFKVMGC